MYQKSLLVQDDWTPRLLQRRPGRAVIDTPGLTQRSSDDYERDSFLASQEGDLQKTILAANEESS